MLSGMNSVISNWLRYTVPILFVPEPKTLDYTQACRSDKGWRFFPLYGCGKNTTACPIAWTGYVWPATINQAMGGKLVFFCSNPIPPVALATDLPAEHVLSRSAGGGGIKQHYRIYCQSSFPKQNTRVLWPRLQRQHSVSFRVWSTCSIYSEV